MAKLGREHSHALAAQAYVDFFRKHNARVVNMLQLPGAPALSSFRIAKLLASFTAVFAIVALMARVQARVLLAIGLAATWDDSLMFRMATVISDEARAKQQTSITDGLTGMEANLRFAGPETMETRIFGRLTAWQNWIFNRPNASGPDGALRRFGTGQRAVFDRKRV